MSRSNKIRGCGQKYLSPEKTSDKFLDETSEELKAVTKQAENDSKVYLAKIANIDQFLAERPNEVDVICLNQKGLLSKNACLRQIKEDLTLSFANIHTSGNY
jgi:hypothetical protein